MVEIQYVGLETESDAMMEHREEVQMKMGSEKERRGC